MGKWGKGKEDRGCGGNELFREEGMWEGEKEAGQAEEGDREYESRGWASGSKRNKWEG